MEFYAFVQICETMKDKSSNLPSKFTPFGESKAFEELQNQKKNKKQRIASPLGFPIQLDWKNIKEPITSTGNTSW